MAACKRTLVDNARDHAMISLVRRFRGHRRTVIIAGSSVSLLLILSGYVLWGNSNWNTYHASYGEWRTETKKKVDTALKLPATNTKEREEKLQALTSVSTTVTSRDRSLCRINGLISWQQSINATYKKWQQDCEAVQTAVGSLNNELIIVTKYLKTERALANILSTALAATSKKVTESSFSVVLAKWKAALSAVKGLEASAEFAPVKAKAQKAVGDVAAAWQAVVTAHVAKDEAKYQKALTALSGAYSALDDIEKESSKQSTGLSQAAQTSYDATF